MKTCHAKPWLCAQDVRNRAVQAWPFVRDFGVLGFTRHQALQSFGCLKRKVMVPNKTFSHPPTPSAGDHWTYDRYVGQVI